MYFNRMSITDAKDFLKKDDLFLIDIRDYNSFKKGHIDNAIHIEDLNIQNFVKEKDKNNIIIIYCYHGNSSQSAANFFSHYGFKHVFSMDEGYEGWININQI